MPSARSSYVHELFNCGSPTLTIVCSTNVHNAKFFNKPSPTLDKLLFLTIGAKFGNPKCEKLYVVRRDCRHTAARVHRCVDTHRHMIHVYECVCM